MLHSIGSQNRRVGHTSQKGVKHVTGHLLAKGGSKYVTIHMCAKKRKGSNACRMALSKKISHGLQGV